MVALTVDCLTSTRSIQELANRGPAVDEFDRYNHSTRFTMK